MPLVVLQKFSSPSPGHRPKYEKGWTYVERRPTRGTGLCRTIRSRAPSPEPYSFRSLCIEDHYYSHNHHCHPDDPIIIPRSPRCRPQPPPCAPTPPAAPTPTPASKPKEKPATDPALAAAAAETARCRAKVIEAYEAAEKRRREAEEMDQKIERRLRETVHPPLSRPLSPYSRAERDWEREREREREQERERERERERDRRYRHRHRHHNHHHPSPVSRIPSPSSTSSTYSSCSYERVRYRSPSPRPRPRPILRRRTSSDPGYGCRRDLFSDLRGDRCRVTEPVGSRDRCCERVGYYDPYYDAHVLERVPRRC